MYHTIQFSKEMTVNLESNKSRYLERVRLSPGERRRAQVNPYVVETPIGPMEVADLFFEDNTVARGVRYSCFRFVD